MKVLFLDVDGVLNTVNLLENSMTNKVIGDEFLNRIQKIKEETDCKIVLSSTWRIYSDLFDYVQAKLKEKKLEIFDVTPDKFDVARATEIKMWLEQFPEVKKFAVIDDDDDADLKDGSFFLTQFETGLTEKTTTSIINYLNT